MPPHQYYSEKKWMFCITEARCRLCSFRIHEGELIRLRTDHYALQGLGEIPFHAKQYLKVGEYGLDFCCHIVCGGRIAEVPCYHSECYNFACYKYGISDHVNASNANSDHRGFRDGNAYNFPPQLWGKQEQERETRLCDLLVEKLKKEVPPKAKFPNEVWRMIAGYLVREFSIVTTHEATRTRIDNINTTIDLTQDVYAEYMLFDGNRYLKSLRNPEDPKGHGNNLILRGQEKGAVREVFIIDDHFGVRDVIFITDRKRQLPMLGEIPSGAWIRRIASRIGISDIQVRGDGFKVRKLRKTLWYPIWLNDLRDIACVQQWEVPSSFTMFDMTSAYPLLDPSDTFDMDHPGFPRMTSLDCNHPDITGYSAFIDELGVNALFAHRPSQKLNIYKEVNPCFPGRWIYMPIDEGEYVTEICSFMEFSCKGLIFITNRGRAGVFGFYSYLLEKSGIDRQHCPPAGPSQIFYHMVLKTHRLAYEDARTPAWREIPQSLIRRQPEINMNKVPQIWHYASCKMEGVARVVPCYRTSAHHKHLIGILFEYEDGHRDCLGEWRFDCAAKPMCVMDDLDRLRLKQRECKNFANDCDREGCVIWDVEIVSAGSLDFGECYYHHYIDMPWSGVCEWWFEELPFWCEHSHARRRVFPQMRYLMTQKEREEEMEEET